MSNFGKSITLENRQVSDANERTETDILAIDDFDDAFDCADDLGVDLAGLDELEDMKERLLMHKRKGDNNPKIQIESAMLLVNKEDEQKRSKLKELLNETKDTLAIFQVENDSNRRDQRGSAAIESLLKTEGATTDLSLNFNSKLESIKSGECLIVVSGETSAGKSTVVNLLLQEDILPTHTLSCTSVITKIAYAPSRRAEIIYNDRRRSPLIMDHLEKDNVMQQVMDAIYIKDIDQREQLSDVREVQLYIPSAILKSGLVFVDTPGIGENDAMDDVIGKFVEANRIMGFIYVIKSDNAGGVQEDRILNLIKVILEHQKKFDDCALHFDPKCAIFLCNLWDNVKKEEANEVYLNAVKKLGQCWPSLDSSQVIRLSAKKARAELNIDPDYIKSDYKLCLEGIKDIFQTAVDRRIKSTYKWIENILIRSAHHLKSLVKGIDLSERDLEDKMKEVFDKLQRLRKRSDGVIEDMRTRIEDVAQEISNQFREYLRSPGSRVAITQWIEDELPPKENSNNWVDVKDEIDKLISNRIAEQLENWEQTTQTVRRLEDQVVIDIRTQLHLLQDDLKDIEGDIQKNDNDSVSSEDEFYKQSDSHGRRISLANFKTSNLNTDSPAAEFIPIKVMTRVKNPMKKFMRNMRKSALFDDIVFAKKLKSYKDNPCKIAKQRAEKKLNAILDLEGSRVLFLFVEGLLERPKQYIQSLVENIPGLIQSNEELMQHIAMCRVDAVDSRSLYERMMEDMEKSRRHLMEYGQGYIFVDDFMGEEISINDELSLSGRMTATFKVSDMVLNSSSHREVTRKGLPRGLWTALQNGFIMKDGNEKNVSIRIYLPSAGIEYTFPEVAKLRCLHHEQIAEFLGVHHSDSPIPAFVYDNHLKSLRQFMKSGFGRLKDDLPKIIIEIAQGIEYLHRKRMVHMELNINTITVTAEGDVKLTGGCLPRHAAFPMDKEAIEVGDFVYLAPEVLNGELYVACADIYALALLLFELFVGCPFLEQLKWKLDHFSSKVDPSVMLELEVNLVEFSESMKNLIMWCLYRSPDSRPSTDIFLQNIKEIKNESMILNKLTNRRINPYGIRRRSNTPSGNSKSRRS